jgi:hypothetical protein
MFFLRLTLYTCGFYLAMALPIILGEFAVEHWVGMFGIHFHGRLGFSVFAALWGLLWFASFLLSFRIVFGARMWDWLFRLSA